MDPNQLVTILSGSNLPSPFRAFEAVDFPPSVGSMWRFRGAPKETFHSNRVLVTGVAENGQWHTVTIVTRKGVTAGDFVSHDEWASMFTPFDLPTGADPT